MPSLLTRAWLATAVCLWTFSTPAIAGYGYGSPTVGSPVGPGTVPPSSYDGGLVNTPNPMDNAGNLVITGNVRGGKHFRGSIPYYSTHSFGASLGSTQLDSFLRYSAVPEELGRYSREYGTFYSPTGTVTMMQPGYRGVFAPTSPRVAGVLMQYRPEPPADVMPITELPQPQYSGGERDPMLGSTMGAWQRRPYLPMSRPSEEVRQVISDELGDQLPETRLEQQGGQLMTPQEYQRQLEQLRQDIQRALPQSEEALPQSVQDPLQETPRGPLGQPLTDPQGRRAPRDPSQGTGALQRPPSLTPQTDGPSTPLPADSLQTDPTIESLSRPSMPANRIDAIFMPRIPGQTADGANAGKLPALQRMEETATAFDPRAKYLEQSPGDLPPEEALSSDRVSSLTDRLRAASGSAGITPGADGPEQLAGDRLRQTQENSVAFSQEQFDRYMQVAEQHMRQGRHYRAADSFTLASLHRPHDSRAHLRRSHALLAAGEYTSSAVALARAVELDSRPVLKKMDLIEAVGGPDQFVRRVTDLEESIERSDAPQLQFLLAYIYYQMDRPEAAKTAIEAAGKGLPTSPAVDLLKAAIGG